MSEDDRQLKKAVIVGWDCASPDLLFKHMLPMMPNLRRLLKRSIHGPLESTKPPVTIPAWMCMMTGCDPGQLGLYGFRLREPGNYDRVLIPNSKMIKQPTLWDFVNNAGGKVAVVGIPPLYPPPSLDGIVVSGFMAPDTDRTYTHPPEFSKTISDLVGDYVLDIEFRTNMKAEIRENLFSMTKKRHELVKHILSNEAWNLFAMLEIGLDRLHHGFLSSFTDDLSSRGQESDSVFEDYYRLLDKQLGEILDLVPNDALFLLVSDHGVKEMKGAFCINQWLVEKGLLVLMKKPESPVSFSELVVDWAKTKAWAWGGYCARIFINIEGYEEQGTVAPEHYEEFRSQLHDALLEIRGPNGEDWNTIVDKPEDIYVEIKGNFPDLMVYFDDLNWRAAGSVGHSSIYLSDNDTGPDDAVHDWYGIYLISDPHNIQGRVEPRGILDIAPTVLRYLGQDVPEYMTGKAIESD
ncbi:MAG: alkaline phosphatase family protein [Promethearchaeota archaeon]